MHTGIPAYHKSKHNPDWRGLRTLETSPRRRRRHLSCTSLSQRSHVYPSHGHLGQREASPAHVKRTTTATARAKVGVRQRAACTKASARGAAAQAELCNTSSQPLVALRGLRSRARAHSRLARVLKVAAANSGDGKGAWREHRRWRGVLVPERRRSGEAPVETRGGKAYLLKPWLTP